jgi:hypothetical protein
LDVLVLRFPEFRILDIVDSVSDRPVAETYQIVSLAQHHLLESVDVLLFEATDLDPFEERVELVFQTVFFSSGF